jgi:hypothetical protein
MLRKEKREIIIRKRKTREEIITTRSTNRTRCERKKRKRVETIGQGTKRPVLTVNIAESSVVDRRHFYRLKLRRHREDLCA